MQPTFVHRARVLLVFLALLFCACASRKSYEPLDAPAVSVERVYEILASAKGSADPDEAEVDRWFGPRAMGAAMRPDYSQAATRGNLGFSRAAGAKDR